MNLFTEIRSLVVGALETMQSEGALPGGLVFLLSAIAGFGVLRRSQTAA